MNMQQTSFLTGSDLVTAPRSRRTDHDSSKIAAKQHQRSGRADSHRAMVLEGVRKHPGRTSKELTEFVDLERHEIHRRLSDMERDELVTGTREQGKQIRWHAR